MRSCIAGPPPRYGTWVTSLMPSAALSSSQNRWPVEPAPRRTKLHRRRVCPHIGREFLERAGRKVLAREQDRRLAAHQTRRHQVGSKIVEWGFVERLVDGGGGGADDHRIAVGR